ncbi:hypothetical protein ATKI12_8961 [Kitasatospora sp. Ki12]|uniref:hypothetical protein n=1 Tax=Kitasatospora xanthocidica TaxID=83382 RepID=UPI001678C44A|nr:hypothetical protein [Kitasatospora xanthocidica]GHF92522.1 hypothetical protein GCM10018790_81890 [Kitasatospora xanthocidica]
MWEPKDPEQLRAVFESVLAGTLAGRGVPSCLGLDTDTDEALWAIEMARPDVPPALVEAARRAFAGQLDGSNAARWRERMERRFADPGD